MINLKFIFRPDWMCAVPHFHFGERHITICLWAVDLTIRWKD